MAVHILPGGLQPVAVAVAGLEMFDQEVADQSEVFIIVVIVIVVIIMSEIDAHLTTPSRA
jgi:hypothetical protein